MKQSHVCYVFVISKSVLLLDSQKINLKYKNIDIYKKNEKKI